MAFSAPTPNNDKEKEDVIAAAYANDPGASMDGKYYNATEVRVSVEHSIGSIRSATTITTCASPFMLLMINTV